MLPMVVKRPHFRTIALDIHPVSVPRYVLQEMGWEGRKGRKKRKEGKKEKEREGRKKKQVMGNDLGNCLKKKKKQVTKKQGRKKDGRKKGMGAREGEGQEEEGNYQMSVGL